MKKCIICHKVSEKGCSKHPSFRDYEDGDMEILHDITVFLFAPLILIFSFVIIVYLIVTT